MGQNFSSFRNNNKTSSSPKPLEISEITGKAWGLKLSPEERVMCKNIALSAFLNAQQSPDYLKLDDTKQKYCKEWLTEKIDKENETAEPIISSDNIYYLIIFIVLIIVVVMYSKKYVTNIRS